MSAITQSEAKGDVKPGSDVIGDHFRFHLVRDIQTGGAQTTRATDLCQQQKVNDPRVVEGEEIYLASWVHPEGDFSALGQ